MRIIVLAAVLSSAVAAAQGQRHGVDPTRVTEAHPEVGPLAFGQPFIPELKLRSWVHGWSLTGASGRAYVLRCDDTFAACSVPVLRSNGAVKDDAVGSLTHSEAAWPWRGLKVELRAELRAGRVSGWAGLWVRVEAADGTVLVSEDMKERPLIGTTSFAWQTVTLTVPENAERLSFGVALHGAGGVFIRQVEFDEAVTEVAAK